MGFRVISTAFMTAALGFIPLFGAVSEWAYGQTRPYYENFYCDIRERENIRVPATIGETANGREGVIYYWGRNYYAETAETSLAICDRVSTLFDTLSYYGLLSSITSGSTTNGSRAICSNSSCRRPIFILMRGENPAEVLGDLRLALQGSHSTRSYAPLSGRSNRTIRTSGVSVR